MTQRRLLLSLQLATAFGEGILSAVSIKSLYISCCGAGAWPPRPRSSAGAGEYGVIKGGCQACLSVGLCYQALLKSFRLDSLGFCFRLQVSKLGSLLRFCLGWGMGVCLCAGEALGEKRCF